MAGEKAAIGLDHGRHAMGDLKRLGGGAAAGRRWVMGQHMAQRGGPGFGAVQRRESHGRRGQHFAQHGQIGGKDGQAGQTGLDSDKAETLPDRGEDEKVGGGEEIGKRAAIQITDQVQAAGNAEPGRLGMEGAMQGALPGKHEVGRREILQDGKKEALVFLWRKAACAHQKRRIRRYAQLLPPIVSPPLG